MIQASSSTVAGANDARGDLLELDASGVEEPGPGKTVAAVK